MELKPTREQESIIQAAARGQSFLVLAGAGAAKTTTLKMLAPELKRAKVLAVAFNKRIVHDLQEALPSTTTVKTLNGLGHGAWSRQRGGRLEVNDQKMTALTKQVMNRMGAHIQKQDEDGSCWSALKR